MIANPYEEIYRANVKKTSSLTTMIEAEKMATQMSFLYNTFGVALKDLVGLLSILYSNHKNQENKNPSI